MTSIINVLVHIDNEVIGKYNYVSNFDYPKLLDSLWEKKKINQYVSLEIFSNISYPHDRDRIDSFEANFYYETIIDNNFPAMSCIKGNWSAGYKVFITNLRPENVCTLKHIRNGKTTRSYEVIKNKKVTYNQKTQLKQNYRLTKITNHNKEEIDYILDGTKIIINSAIYNEYYLYYDNINDEEINNLKVKKSSSTTSICNLFNTLKGYKKVPNDEENKLL